jgi:hypothetical protein
VKFDKETMDSRPRVGSLDEEDQENCVVLPICPGLIKHGDSQGRHFETSSVVIKPVVETLVWVNFRDSLGLDICCWLFCGCSETAEFK